MIDLTSDDFRFISKEDEDPYWVVGSVVKCESVYVDYLPNKRIGFFGIEHYISLDEKLCID